METPKLKGKIIQRGIYNGRETKEGIREKIERPRKGEARAKKRRKGFFTSYLDLSLPIFSLPQHFG